MAQDNKTFDAEAVREIARADYEVFRQIARDRSLSVAAAGAQVDAELARRTRVHIAGMTPFDADQFMQAYNAEYNSLVVSKLQKNTGCAIASVVIIISAASALIYSALAEIP
jgi:hypothetical protein